MTVVTAGIGRQPLLALLIAASWCGVLGSAAAVIYVKHRSRALFVELERANAQRDNLEIEWGQLQLEQSAWSTHAFVERIAEAKLRMGMPPPQAIQIVTQSAAAAALPSPTRAPAGAVTPVPTPVPTPVVGRLPTPVVSRVPTHTASRAAAVARLGAP